MPGPLPKPEGQRRNRNKPRIPTTSLPAGGCTDPIPEPPEWVELGKKGQAWWNWAWRTPQAAGWSDRAHLDSVAIRASLQDDIAALEAESLAGLSEDELRDLVRSLKGLVLNKTSVLTRIKDYDDRLGLSPLAMGKLRWTIVADEGEAPASDSPGSNVVTPDRWKRTGT